MSIDYSVSVPEGTCGAFSIRRFEVPKNSLALIQYGHRAPDPGWYTGLFEGESLWMSDTQAEVSDHLAAIWQIQKRGGNVLINGLGIGLVVQAALKCTNVERVDVVEISADVIALAGPHYCKDERVHIHNADALTFSPPVAHYSVVWHDIWQNICGDNLAQMKLLHRRYGRRADWQGSWSRYECERQERQWKRQKAAWNL